MAQEQPADRGPGTGEAQPYPKAQRLLNLLMALRATGVGLDRDQLRAQVRGYDAEATAETFARMFERDKDELRAMGVPVTSLMDASGAVTGYRIAGSWALPALDLDRAELAVLRLAARLWQRGELGTAALNALRKVEAQLGVGAQEAEGPAAPIAGLTADSPVLHDLVAAAGSHTTVTFDYRKGETGPAQPRQVQPWGVVLWRAHWYLVGHDLDRGAQRVFRASRISGAVHPLGDPGAFEVPSDFDAAAAIGRFNAADRILIEVALAPGAGAALRQQAVQTQPGPAGGWDLVTFPAETPAEGVGRVLALGATARVRGPQEALAEALVQLDALVRAQEQPADPSGRVASGHARLPGNAQFSRMLALVPWLVANDGVTVAQAARHFGVSRDQLVADLGLVITSGPTDWNLFDIQYWDDDEVIVVLDPLELAKPLTLTRDEGFAMLVALDALAALPGTDQPSAVASATAKVRAALGGQAPAPGTVSVRVDLPEEPMAAIEQARAGGRVLHLTYLGGTRDEITRRTVDPVDVVVVDGYGYLRAHCRTAGAPRKFRLDRILDLRVGLEPAEPVALDEAAVEPMAVALAGTGRAVVVDVALGSPVLDRHPVSRRWTLPGGRIRAELPVGDFAWARQLVLRSGGSVVLREPEWLADEILAVARELRRQVGSETVRHQP